MWSEWVFTLSSIMLSGFKVQESGPNMHIGRLHDYILSQLILSFKSLKIKKKKQATQVGTVPSPQSILDAYQQGADPNTMVSAAGPWSCGSFIVTCGWILYIYIIYLELREGQNFCPDGKGQKFVSFQNKNVIARNKCRFMLLPSHAPTVSFCSISIWANGFMMFYDTNIIG